MERAFPQLAQHSTEARVQGSRLLQPLTHKHVGLVTQLPSQLGQRGEDTGQHCRRCAREVVVKAGELGPERRDIR